ncbi:MAG: PadR family transcriptional regulator [Gemmatimonadales bacterium]
MSPRAKTDILQGMLDMLILRTVADAPLHGYGIAQRLRLLSAERLQIPQGSLYPALHRLENRGFLRSEWTATPTGRDAKFYRLTPKGRRELDEQISTWRDLAGVIGLVLENA